MVLPDGKRKGKKGKKENRKAKLVCITYNACISMYVKSVCISNSMYNLGLTSLGFQQKRTLCYGEHSAEWGHLLWATPARVYHFQKTRKILDRTRTCLWFHSWSCLTGCLICHWVKSVQIRSYFWSIFSCIRTEYRKILTRNNSVFGHFSRSCVPTKWPSSHLLLPILSILLRMCIKAFLVFCWRRLFNFPITQVKETSTEAIFIVW